jgi:hypothetical protein
LAVNPAKDLGLETLERAVTAAEHAVAQNRRAFAGSGIENHHKEDQDDDVRGRMSQFGPAPYVVVVFDDAQQTVEAQC